MDITNNLVCGCIPSKLDGTEYKAEFGNFEIPDEFTYEPIMPYVRDQGLTSTCVCQTLTGMLDVQKNSEENTPNKCNNFSIDELYQQRSNKPQEGMSIKEAMSILRHKGLNGEKIDNYAMVTSTTIAKQALIANGPLAIGMMCYDNGTDYFWRNRGRHMGGHCTMVVGYTTTGFIIRNSWGTSWGHKGYLEIPYHEFEQYCMECWTFTL